MELDNTKLAMASKSHQTNLQAGKISELETKLLAKDKQQIDAINDLIMELNKMDTGGKPTEIKTAMASGQSSFNDSLFLMDSKGQKKIGLFVKPENKDKMIVKTQKYIDKYFNQGGRKSPMTGQAVVEMAEAGKFPVGLILANAHLESHGATMGRGADSNNPHNIGNTDAGDGKMTVCGQFSNCLKDWTVGTKMFINLITNCYMSGEIATTHEFISNDFRTQRVSGECSSVKVGSRYMTDTNAPNKYRSIAGLINSQFLE